MPSAVITFEFDPYLRLDLGAVRWETLGIAGSILLAMIAAAILAGRTPAGRDAGHLRRDDLLFIALGAVPGAVIGGRLGYALLHLEFYRSDPGALFDVATGGLQLSLAVVGGTITGLYVARLLEVPTGRWLHVAAVPLLVALEGGKLAMAWGGSGQGRPAEGTLATAYLGAGPWGSLAPALPSVPSQLLEGGATGVLAVALVIGLMGGAFRSRDGRLYGVAFGGWLVIRLVVASTWRDPAVLGPLSADQAISIALLVGVVVAFVLAGRRVPGGGPEGAATTPDWPDADEAVRWRDRHPG